MKRRTWLGLGAGGAAAWLAGPAVVSCAPRGAVPKNIVFLVSDGMSQSVPGLAESFSRLARGRGTHWQALMSSGQAALGCFDMASEDSLVTDSAAAASAWASGRRVANGSINMYADRTPLKPLIPLVQDRGKAAGLVTTARLTHATPAAFAAQVAFRDDEDEIAEQYAAHAPEVLLGGGSFHFDALTRADSRDLGHQFQEKGWLVVQDREALRRASGVDRLFGTFAVGHLPYTLDQMHDPALTAAVPTLAEMTRAALQALSRRREGFFLMVEGARVDHAAHANCAAGILWEQLALDDALGEVLAYQKDHPETLVIASSDHGNSNPGLNGMGAGYRESTGCFARLARARATAPTLRRELMAEVREGRPIRPATVREVIARGTGLVLMDHEATALVDVLTDRPSREIFSQHGNFYGLLGQILGNWQGVGWTGVTHTADWTLSVARGPGQEGFAGLMKNTDFFERVATMWGIGFRNPPNVRPSAPVPPAERALADPTG